MLPIRGLEPVVGMMFGGGLLKRDCVDLSHHGQYVENESYICQVYKRFFVFLAKKNNILY